MQKKKTYRSAKYMKWLRSRPCSVTGLEDQSRVVAHHVRAGNAGGVSLKPSDYRCIPLESLEHQKLHNNGEKSYYKNHGLNTDELICMNLLVYIAANCKDHRALIDNLEEIADTQC